MSRDVGDDDRQSILVDPQNVEVVTADGGARLEQRRELDRLRLGQVERQQALLDVAGE